jgi:hypothetical protein
VLENTGHQIPFTRPDAVIDAIDRVASKATASLGASSLGARTSLSALSA